MSAPFDYAAFKQEYNLHNTVRQIFTAIQNVTAADPPTQQAVQALLGRFNLNEEVAADPVFDFECVGVTVQDYTQQCANAQPARNLMTWMQSRGNRLYYVIAGNPDNNAVWAELTRPEASDPAVENAELIFLDPNCTVVDWQASLDNLKRLGLDRRYTMPMMKTTLLRIIAKVMPEQTPLLQDKNANQIAVFLLKMDGRLDKLPLYRQQLLAFQRKPLEELTSALARLTNLVDKMHPENVPENLALRDQIFRTALISLTPDSIAIPLIEDIKKAKALCTPMTLIEIRGVVMAAETRGNVTLNSPLSFGRPINNQSLESIVHLNSMRCDIFRKRLPYDFYGEEIYQDSQWAAPAYGPPPYGGPGAQQIALQQQVLLAQQQQHQQQQQQLQQQQQRQREHEHQQQQLLIAQAQQQQQARQREAAQDLLRQRQQQQQQQQQQTSSGWTRQQPEQPRRPIISPARFVPAVSQPSQQHQSLPLIPQQERTPRPHAMSLQEVEENDRALAARRAANDRRRAQQAEFAREADLQQQRLAALDMQSAAAEASAAAATARAEQMWRTNTPMFSQLSEATLPQPPPTIKTEHITLPTQRALNFSSSESEAGSETRRDEDREELSLMDQDTTAVAAPDMTASDPNVLVHASESFFQNLNPQSIINNLNPAGGQLNDWARPTQLQAAAMHSTPGFGLNQPLDPLGVSPVGQVRGGNPSDRGRTRYRHDAPYRPPSHTRRTASAEARLLHPMETRSAARQRAEDNIKTEEEDEEMNSNRISLNSMQFRDGSRSRYPSRDRDRSRLSERYSGYSRGDNSSYRDRRDRYRSSSRGRDFSRHLGGRDNSRARSSSRNGQHNRGFSQSRDNRDRSLRRDNSRTRANYSRQPSRDRRDFSKTRDNFRRRENSRSPNRNRSQSRGGERYRPSSHYSGDRRDNSRRSQSRDFSKSNSYRSNSRDKSRSRSKESVNRYSRDRSSSRTRDNSRSRDKSQEMRRTYPSMKKGENCGYDYNPQKKKRCRKCPAGETHHEFECYKYPRFNHKKCTVCEKFNHYGKDCKEISSFPPKQSELNSSKNA